jgi:PIN domain nuclease of toxin-antitoxin system
VRLLLDTHIWIWNDLEPWKLSSDVNRELAKPENELWLSPVSIWELALQLDKKRITLQQDVRSWVEESVADLHLREAALTWEVAHAFRFAVLPQRDPADRLLVATARVHDLTLVTADAQLMSAPGLKLLANR